MRAKITEVMHIICNFVITIGSVQYKLLAVHQKYVCVLSCSIVSDSFFEAAWTVAHQAPLTMEFSRQEYWSGVPFPTPQDLPNPGIEPMSLESHTMAVEFFTTSTTWETHTKN